MQNKAFLLKHWSLYNLTDTKEDFIILLNILEAHEETIDSLHNVVVNGLPSFCDIEGDFNTDQELVSALFEYHNYFVNEEVMKVAYARNANMINVTVDEYISQYSDIRLTTDGIVDILKY